MPNFLVSNRELLAVYSNFEIVNSVVNNVIDEVIDEVVDDVVDDIVGNKVDGVVTIDDNLKELYFYLSSNNNNVKNYVADFDISYDSDLN
jgi:hypothetical protein